MALSVETRLRIKELELTSLFETIDAINTNASEEDLYKIFKFTIASNPLVKGLLLFVHDDEKERWSCAVTHGVEGEPKTWRIPKKCFDYTEPSPYHFENEQYSEFDFIIPVTHKSRALAYVLIAKEVNGKDGQLAVEFIEALANIVIVAVENKKLARKEAKQREYKRQLDIAKNVQTLLFPKTLPDSDKLSVEASYLPHHTIGGDYYDFIQVDKERFLLCVADVSGKGLPAAILMSNFQGGVRTLVRKEKNLEVIVNELNHLIMENARGENFITAFLMIYNTVENRLVFVNAGHNPPFLYRNNQFERLEEGTTILGSFKKLPFLETGVIDDIKEFFVFCFTDGFTETYNDKGEELGDEQLLKFLESNIDHKQKAMHQNLIAHLNTFKGHQAYADDITLLSCRVNNQ